MNQNKHTEYWIHLTNKGEVTRHRNKEKEKKVCRENQRKSSRFSFSILFSWNKGHKPKYLNRIANFTQSILLPIANSLFFLVLSKADRERKSLRVVDSSWKVAPSWNPLIQRSIKNFWSPYENYCFLWKYPNPRLRITIVCSIFDWFS